MTDREWEQLARDTFDFISGDIFGMTPDPWICGEYPCERHLCDKSVKELAEFLYHRIYTNGD